MPDQPPFTAEQIAALKRVKVYWVTTLLVVLPLPFIALPLTGSAFLEEQPEDGATRITMIALAIGIGALLIGMHLRNQAYKAHWRGDVVEPEGYTAGNRQMFSFIVIAAAGLFALSVLSGYPAPTFASAPILAGLLLINLPNGKPMRPHPPRLSDDAGATR